MKRKVYFAGSIRGGRKDAELYHTLIQEIKKTEIVLTEHIGDLSLSLKESTPNADQAIYTQDTNWLKEANLVIAECTSPSLGVGYELAYAERFQIPVYILYRPAQVSLSAMLKGNPYFKILPYETTEDAIEIIHTILYSPSNY